MRQTLAQTPEQLARAAAILMRIAAQVTAALDLTRARDQGETQTAGADMTGLSHPIAVEPHEIG